MKRSRINKTISFFRRNALIIPAIVFWIVVTFYTDRFVQKIFSDSLSAMIQKEKNLLFFIVLISLVLLIFIVVYLLKLIISSFKKVFGARIRLKLTVFFLVITMIPVVPFMRIGMKFIESSMNIWFSKNMGNALEYSEAVIKGYYNDKKKLLNNSAYQVAGFIDNTPLDKIEYQRIINEDVVNVSVWNGSGQIIMQTGEMIFNSQEYLGEQALMLSDLGETTSEISDNYFTLEFEEKAYLILPVRLISKQNSRMVGYINIAAVIVPEFVKATGEIDIALAQYNTLNVYKMFLTRGFAIIFVGMLFPIILVVLAITIFLTARLLEPVRGLFDGIKRISIGDYDFQLEIGSDSDEFEVLSNSFNLMISELEMDRSKILQGQRVATWQEIARRLAHELRNPLTPIRLSSQRIIKKYTENAPDFDAVIKKGVDSIIREVERMDLLLNRFSGFALMNDTLKTRGGIVELVKDIITLYSGTENVWFDFVSTCQDYICNRDPDQFKSVVSNLIKNSIESIKDTQKDGKIEIFMDKKNIGYNDYVVIIIRDNGSGIETPADQDIFEPYFTTKKDGSGLGLAIAQRIVADHNGRIYYTTIKGTGTTFYIELPIIK